MKTKEERNALKEEVEAESKEPRKLTDEELAQVSGGGVSQNPDGTYNIYLGDIFTNDTSTTYQALETKLGATLETYVRCEVFTVGSNGDLSDLTVADVLVRILLKLI